MPPNRTANTTISYQFPLSYSLPFGIVPPPLSTTGGKPITAKTSAARRAAFFAALAATGNRTLACERARVSQSWVGLHAREEPGFRAEMDAAISFDDAMRLLGLHRRRLSGIGGQPGRARRRVTLDDVRDSIRRKVEAIQRAAALGLGDDAAPAPFGDTGAG